MCNAYLAGKVRDAVPEITQEKALVVVRSVMRGVQDSLEARGEVRLSGVGTIRVVNRPARVRRNPQTGEKVSLEANRAARFKASATLDRMLNAQVPDGRRRGRP